MRWSPTPTHSSTHPVEPDYAMADFALSAYGVTIVRPKLPRAQVECVPSGLASQPSPPLFQRWVCGVVAA